MEKELKPIDYICFMTTTKRIMATLGVIALTLLLLYACIEAASTPAGLSVEGRRLTLISGFIILIVGFISTVAIWLPWKNMKNKK